MHILLIEQLRTKKTRYKPFEKLMLTSFSILPTLYMRRIAAITPDHHSITLVNERYNPIPTTNTNTYDLVLIHFTTASALRAYEVADQFKKQGNTVILCGLHASALPEEGLNHADSILLGRGEANWLTLLYDAEHHQLKTLYPPESYENLSKPIPPTKVNLPGFQIMGALEATRGCPYHCSFCPESNTPNGSFFYKRPVDEVIKEIKKMPQKIIMFYDASLTIDPAYTKQLFQQMIPLHKRFFCNGNVDVLASDDELVLLSKKAGCIGWLIGFESISQDTIDSFHKKTNTVSIYQKAIDTIHNHHMMVIGDFMFGFDTDTKEVFQKTVDTIIGLGIDVADFTIATPFPGTPFYSHLEKEKRINTHDWKQYSMYTVVYEPKHMSKQELSMGIFSVYKQFYKPSYALRRILQGSRLGIYPFFSILFRNAISLIASTKISD